MAAIQLPGGVIHDLDLPPRVNRLLLSFSNAVTPGDLYLVEVKTGEVKRLTRTLATPYRTSRSSEPSLINYPTQDRMMIPAFLYLPPTLREGEKAPCLFVPPQRNRKTSQA
jgi:dipeptidyl aminopeptidase/acylaminoacyl peptidase